MRSFWLAVALLAHLTLAGTYAWRAPAWEGPDENDHAYYASFLAATGRQPTILQSSATTGRAPHEEASLGHHPPLYYAILGGLARALGSGDYTPFWSPNPAWPVTSDLKWQHGRDEQPPVSREIGMLRVLRCFSVLLGAVSITLTWALARVLFSTRLGIADAAVVGLACLPQWSWMHGVLDNGNLATALAAATLLVLARGARAGALGLGTGAALGLLLGVALLTKLTALFLLPMVAVAYAHAVIVARGGRGRLFASAAIAFGLAALLSGAWFWRNATLYGDPLALAPHAVAYASNRVPADLRSSYIVGDFVWRTLHSTFAGVGWSCRAAPRAAEYAAAVVALLALLGVAARARVLAREGGAPLGTSLVALGLTVAGLVQYNLTFFQPQGRYLFPAIGVVAILLGAGLAQLPLAKSIGRVAGFAVVVGALVLQHTWFLPMLTPEPVDEPRYASYHEGLHTPAAPAQRTLVATAPAPDARLDTPPTFRWLDPQGTPSDAYSLILTFPDGVAFATWETARVALTGGEWSMPASYWAALPHGQAVRWRVRRIADRARGEAARDQAESDERTLLRQP